MIALEKSFLVQEGRFEKCRIGDFFNVGTGSLLNAKEIKSGDIKRVSVKSDNNGIIGEFNTLDVVNARHFEKFISVNFFGDVFYHDYLASVEMKVHTLHLKSGKELNKKLGLYLSSLIRKALNNRFGYGNQLSSSKLKEGAFYIELPMLRGQPAWDFMERYIEELEAERIEELEAYLRVTGLNDYHLSEDEINCIKSLDINSEICGGGGGG
ncbi:hypothetical protein AO411_2027515 [Salmonella enterica subsp. enterica serovar Sarajane]|nr:hypothetical protein AO411_2027515 [Salmonella enterica subsp. enterica serovar Sarajane]